MADDYLMDVDFSDLDLNQVPSNPPLRRVERYGSLLNELETAHDTIEERIRQLEVVTARTRQRQRWRQARNPAEMSYFPSEMLVGVDQRGSPNESSDVSVFKRNSERGKGCKRDSSHLVAKALELGLGFEAKKVEKDGGSFYDCNICLDVAKEPVLTCCGHLFCWSCFYQVSDVDSTSKECPVCKGEVSSSTVIPIYGNGDCERVSETESGLKIPPRPKARRVESVRQQRASQGLSHVPVAEALRRIRISIGAVGNQTQHDGGSGSGSGLGDAESQTGQNSEAGGGHHRLRIHQVSRVLSESAASLSSLSSALSNAERLVEDLEAVINRRPLLNDDGSIFTRASAAIQADHHHPSASASTAEDSNVALPITSDVVRARVSGDVSLPSAPSSSSSSFRRRTLVSRSLDVDGRDPRELRRRRLN